MSKFIKTSDLTDESNKYANIKDFIEDAYFDFKATTGALNTKSFKLGNLEYAQARKNLPYIIHPTDTPGVSIMLNRDYKPIYCNHDSGNWVDYSNFPQHMVILHPVKIQFISINGSNPGYLFNDKTAPWNSFKDAKLYLTRLWFLKNWV